MRKTKHHLIAFFAGVLLFLLVLEVSLRIVGSIYTQLSEFDKELTSDAHAISSV